MSGSLFKNIWNRIVAYGGSVSFFPGTDAAEKKFHRLLFLISLGALLLRVVAAFEMGCAGDGLNNMFAPPPTSDLATYMTLGREIAAGKFPELFYYQPLYYACFLPLIYLLSGKAGVIAVIGVQLLLSSATVYLAGLCGRRIFSRRAGIITAVMCAISSPLILYVPFHQNETVHCWLLTLLFFLVLRAVDKWRWRDWAFAGVICGAAICNRGNINLLLPVIIAVLAVSGRQKQISFRRIVAVCGMFLICTLLFQLPFIIHNSRTLKRFSGPSTAANAVLGLGNTVEAPAGGRDPGLPAGAMYYPEAYRRAMERTLGRNGVSMARQMWDWFCDEPAAFLELQFRKALLFWDGREIPNNVSLYFDGFYSRVLRWLLPGRSVVLLTLAIAGIFWFIPELKRNKNLPLITLYGFVLIFYLAVIAFYMLSRFRAPVLPLLFVFGGGFVDGVIGRVSACERSGRSRLLKRVLLILLISFGFTFSFYEFYRLYLEAPVNRWLRPGGIVLANGGRDIQYFDHGPMPFGGWSSVPAEVGMKMQKSFAGCSSLQRGILYFSVSNSEAVKCELLINNRYQILELPALLPGKSPRKMTGLPVELVNGSVEMEVLSCSAPLDFIYDNQRDYRRSALNGKLLPGEWVFRFGSFH